MLTHPDQTDNRLGVIKITVNKSTVNELTTYELTADDFNLVEGELLAPGVEIGIDSHSGGAVCLDCWSSIREIYYHPMNDSYRVTIYRLWPASQAARRRENALISA